MIWQAEAPSNIALIKYMGKSDAQQNVPTNHSLSYTLNHLLTQVELELTDAKVDHWQPLKKPGYETVALSDKAIIRFLKHLSFLKNHFGLEKNFIVRSANNFPADCGLASSASSYAALTRCAISAVSELLAIDGLSISEQAMLSRQGSGSSCRSFFSPWALWQDTTVFKPEISYDNLIHQVVVVAKEKKAVSSSDAHRRVPSSDLFIGRPERANKRLDNLLTALKHQDWEQAYQISWQEFWDMHALFETAKPSFGYVNQHTLSVINSVRDTWLQQHDGPIVTLDAGPNIHLLYRPDQTAIAQSLKQQFSEKFLLLDNQVND